MADEPQRYRVLVGFEYRDRRWEPGDVLNAADLPPKSLASLLHDYRPSPIIPIAADAAVKPRED